MNLNRLRLKWKIFAFLLGFCALLLFILWMFQTVFLEAFYKNVRVLEIKRDASIIASYAGNADIQDIAGQISDINDLVIDITDMNGNSILTAVNQQDARMAMGNTALITQADNKGGEFYQYISPMQDRPGPPGWSSQQPQSLVYVKLINLPVGGRAIIIRAIVGPVNATVTTLRYQLYIISGIMLLFSIVLAIVIAKRVSKPIEEISRSAQTLAKGNYDTRFTGKGFSEIVALSDTLNTAAVELGRVENLRRELLANVSHDLRTPLALIYSYAELMNDFPEEITPEQTKTILNETQRLTSLVNDVLDISKLESDMEQLNASRYNLTESILNIVGQTGELLKKDGFEIEFSYEDDVYVTGDEVKIGRAFYNLLINAVNYSGDSRKVTVTQGVSADCVRISVKDNGEGITEAELPFIWDRYYKSGKKHKRAVMGTGLGLSIVKKIIGLHGGRYGVISEFGKGSTFWFELDQNKSDKNQPEFT